MTAVVTVDVAGGQVGGAARFRAELSRYLAQTKRADVRIIGTARQLDAAWLLRREVARPTRGRRVSLNNVSFVTAGSERWTLLRNPLDFLTDREESGLDPSVRAATRRRAPVVHAAARRAHVLVVPSTAMAERVTRVAAERAKPGRCASASRLGRLDPANAPLSRHPVPSAFRALQVDDRAAH